VVVVGGIPRSGCWTCDKSDCWRFDCISPVLTASEVDAGVCFEDTTHEVTVQQLILDCADSEPSEADSFAEIVIAEIQSCRELLDLEPRTKWPQLTLTSLMVLVGWPLHATEPILHNLTQDDSQRARYYTDVASQLRIRDAIHRQPPLASELDLCGLKLTSFVSSDARCVGILSLNLSSNHLVSTEALCGAVLPMLQELDLSTNRLVRISFGSISSMHRLTKLDLNSNKLKTVHGLTGSAALRQISLFDNPSLEDTMPQICGYLPLDSASLEISGLSQHSDGLLRVGNWVFSADLSNGDLNQIKSLIALNGLSCEDQLVAPAKNPVDSEAADVAFAAMVAANPEAKVVGDAPVLSVEEQAAAADEAFAKMMSAYPNAKVVH